MVNHVESRIVMQQKSWMMPSLSVVLLVTGVFLTLRARDSSKLPSAKFVRAEFDSRELESSALDQAADALPSPPVRVSGGEAMSLAPAAVSGVESVGGHVQASLYSVLSVEDVERMFGISEVEYSTLLQKYVGWTPIEDVQDVLGLDSQFPASRFDESIVLALNEAARPFNSEIEVHARALIDCIAAAKMRAWEAKMLDIARIGDDLPTPTRAGEELLYSGTGNVEGFVFAYRVYAADYPQIVRLKADLSEMRKERRRHLRQVLAQF